MKSSMLKYKWMCFALACCTLFAACEPASTTSTQNPISFGAGRKNSAYNPDLNDGINATLWGYRTYNDTTTTVFAGVGARLYETDETESGYDLEINSATQYWNIGTYQFYSVSPQLENASITNNALTISDFDISSQTDIIAAATTGIPVTKLEYNEPVTLNYKHLLTKIKFRAQTTQNTCTIIDFSITVPKTATYTSSSWGTKSGSCPLEMPEDQEITTSLVVLDLDGTTGTNDNGWLIFPGTVTNEAIEYSIQYKVGDKEQPTQTGKLPPLTDDDGGLAGNSYIYTFTITPFGPIIFGNEVKVEGWGDRSEINLDFDITPEGN